LYSHTMVETVLLHACLACVFQRDGWPFGAGMTSCRPGWHLIGPEILQDGGKKLIKMTFLRYRNVFTLLLLAALAGCSQPQNSQDLKEQTAQATAEVKRDAKAVAAEISEGWSRDKPLDLNAATKEQLLSLPGVTGGEADRVIAGRPYSEPGDVVTRRIMTKIKYDKIADRVTAKK
jgi:DNA uptake protein ComE-like DNA-binding protein